MQQSSRWKGVATIREARTSSAVYGPRPYIIASGLVVPLLRMVAATSASWREVVPYSCMCRAATSANWATT